LNKVSATNGIIVTLFPGDTPHRISPERQSSPLCIAWWQSNPTRVSLAFDIATIDHMPALQNAVILYDPHDPAGVTTSADDIARTVNEQFEELQTEKGARGRLRTLEDLEHARFVVEPLLKQEH